MDFNKIISIIDANSWLSPEQLDQLKATDAKTFGKTAVDKGWLTKWQVRRLIAGKHNFRIGDYRLFDFLGKDNFGEVYLARGKNNNNFRLRLIPADLDQAKLEQYLDRVAAFQNLSNAINPLDVEIVQASNRTLIASSAPSGNTVAHLIATDAIDQAIVDKTISVLSQALVAFESAQLQHQSIHEKSLFLSDDGNIFLDLPKDVGWQDADAKPFAKDSIAFCQISSKLSSFVNVQESDEETLVNNKFIATTSPDRKEAESDFDTMQKPLDTSDLVGANNGDDKQDTNLITQAPNTKRPNTEQTKDEQSNAEQPNAEQPNAEQPKTESSDDVSNDNVSNDNEFGDYKSTDIEQTPDLPEPPVIPPPTPAIPSSQIPMVEESDRPASKNHSLKRDPSRSKDNSGRVKLMVTVVSLVLLITVLTVVIISQLGKPNNSASTAKNNRSKNSPDVKQTRNILDQQKSASETDSRGVSSGLLDSTPKTNTPVPNDKSPGKTKIAPKPKVLSDSDLLGKMPKNSDGKTIEPKTSKGPSPPANAPKKKSSAETSPKTKTDEPKKKTPPGNENEEKKKPAPNPVLLIGKEKGKKTEPATAQKIALQKPFRDVPKFVNLPPVSSNNPKTLFPIHLPQGFPLTLKLHGGYFASQDGFEFDLRKSTSQDNTWMVYGGPKDEPQQIGQFNLKGNQLSYSWKPNASGLVYSNSLKNCGIGLTAGAINTNFALRSPVTIPSLDFTKSLNSTMQTKVPDLPNLESVNIALFRIPQKLNPFTPTGKKKTLTGRADSLDLNYKIQNISVFKLNLTSRFDSQSGLRIRAVSHVISADKREIKLTSVKNLEDLAKEANKEADAIMNAFKQMVENNNKNPDKRARANFTRTRQYRDEAAKNRTAGNIKKQIAESLSVGKKLDQSKIGLRVYYKAGEMEIDLAKSKIDPPPVAQKNNSAPAKNPKGKQTPNPKKPAPKQPKK